MDPRSINSFQVFLMVMLIIFWGSSFVVVKQLIAEGLSPIGVATFRFIIAGALFVIVLFVKKHTTPGYNLSIKSKDLWKLLALALTGVTFFFTIQYTGIKLAGASIAAILVCLISPILITIFSIRLFGEHVRRQQNIGLIAASAGTLIVVSTDFLNLEGNIQFLVGTLILLSTPVMWTVYTLMGKKIMLEYDPFLVVSYVSLIGGLCLIPFAIVDHSIFQIFNLNTYQWLGILYLSVTCSLLGYYIWFYVLKKTGSTSSTFLFAEPLITAIFAYIFINETLYPSVIVGAVLIFVGVLLVTNK
jgi:drug/metabolite transporter (DMT)-like permease